MDETVQQQAMNFLKANKSLLIERFVSRSFSREEQPLSIFMAGSPGAGKTEFSKRLLDSNNIKAVRIDADDIRGLLPQYTGSNSADVQSAASRGVHVLYDYVLKHGYSMLLDGTFAYEEARRNVVRSIKRNRYVEIFYVYQSPLVAWRFTKARERIEGRKVFKQTFVRSLFRAWKNVQKVKDEFGDDVKLHVIVKNFSRGIEKEFFDVDWLEKYVEIPYTQGELLKKLV